MRFGQALSGEEQFPFPAGRRPFHDRPLGGGIEFGETSEATLKREFIEEIGAELANCSLVAVTENIFTYEGRKGHEICFIYEADFADESLYLREEFKILDSSSVVPLPGLMRKNSRKRFSIRKEYPNIYNCR